MFYVDSAQQAEGGRWSIDLSPCSSCKKLTMWEDLGTFVLRAREMKKQAKFILILLACS